MWEVEVEERCFQLPGAFFSESCFSRCLEEKKEGEVMLMQQLMEISCWDFVLVWGADGPGAGACGSCGNAKASVHITANKQGSKSQSLNEHLSGGFKLMHHCCAVSLGFRDDDEVLNFLRTHYDDPLFWRYKPQQPNPKYVRCRSMILHHLTPFVPGVPANRPMRHDWLQLYTLVYKAT